MIPTVEMVERHRGGVKLHDNLTVGGDRRSSLLYFDRQEFNLMMKIT